VFVGFVTSEAYSLQLPHRHGQAGGGGVNSGRRSTCSPCWREIFFGKEKPRACAPYTQLVDAEPRVDLRDLLPAGGLDHSHWVCTPRIRHPNTYRASI